MELIPSIPIIQNKDDASLKIHTYVSELLSSENISQFIIPVERDINNKVITKDVIVNALTIAGHIFIVSELLELIDLGEIYHISCIAQSIVSINKQRFIA